MTAHKKIGERLGWTKLMSNIKAMVVRFLAPEIIDLLVSDVKKNGELVRAIIRHSDDSLERSTKLVKAAINRDLERNGPLTRTMSQLKKSNPPPQ